MLHVLFVCLGNICRSPMAEGVFQQLVQQAGLSGSISTDSAGTASYHIGSLPDRRMRQVAQEYGITLTHRGRKLSGDDFYHFDYIVAMDETNYEDIRNQSYRSSGFYYPEDRLFLYRQFDPTPDASLAVPDPYYEDISAFDEVYQIVERCGTHFLEFLIETNQLRYE
jgi:protein-tyrosine phosphatase